MPAIITVPQRVVAAQKLISGLSDPRSSNNYYFFIAKTDIWTTSDGINVTENSPPLPIDCVEQYNSCWAKMIHVKKINPSNCVTAILRQDWIKNMVYPAYTHDIDLFDPTKNGPLFYVFTEDFNVYKCLSNNNGGPSFVKPSGQSTNIISTADKYQWKFMFNVSSADAEKFLTDHYIPVKQILIPDNSPQSKVQESAVPGSINVIQVLDGGAGYATAPAITVSGDGFGASAVSIIANGSVQSILITNPGSNYSFATATAVGGQVTVINVLNGGSGFISAPTVIFTGGGGTGAAALANITNGSISSITITNAGSNYTAPPTVSFSSGSAEASVIISGNVNLKPIISPNGGHGSSAITELGGFFVIIDQTLNSNESNFTVSNDYRQIGLIWNPQLWNTTDLAAASTYSQLYGLHFFSVTGTFNPDDAVLGEVSGANGIVLDYDSVNKILRVVNVTGEFLAGETVRNTGNTETGLLQKVSGTVNTSGVLSLNLGNLDTTPTNGYKGFTVRITSNTGEGQQRVITANSLQGGNQILTIDVDWQTYPDNTSTYSIAEIDYPALEPFTGFINYVENKRPITRSLGEIEDFKIVMEF